MGMNLGKKWFEKHIQHDENFEVGAGLPEEANRALSDHPEVFAEKTTDEGLAEKRAFGALIQLLRRDRQLSLEELALQSSVEVGELRKIENEPQYIPKPRSVHQLAVFWGLPPNALLKISSFTINNSPRWREATYRFVANSSSTAQLSREERVALTEFVEFLEQQNTDQEPV